MITSDSLLLAIDRERVRRAALVGSYEPIPYSDIATEIGVHRSLFSRLKGGTMPSGKILGSLVKWLGDEKLAHCETCTEVDADGIEVITEATLDAVEEAEAVVEAVEEEVIEEVAAGIKAVFAFGRLSDSDDPETQSAVARVRELLAEGAVGVSVALDLHPDDVPVIMEAEKKQAEGGWEKPIEDYFPEGFTPRQRVRHTAIVDTPAFADARLVELEDGSLEGEIVFEGVYTGDGRTFPVDSIDLNDSRVPSPIIWDRLDGDHTGMTVGYLTSWERRDAIGDTSARVVLDDEAITASLAPMTLPAAYFAQTVPKKAQPMRISKPDANGYRSINGLAAPNGVCIRQATTCWTWPGDKDKSHRHFHTGTLLRLDDGSDIRVGALTIGGAHLEGALAKQGVTARDTSNHRDNANRVFALVRVWETRFGLMMSGVIPPDVTEGDVARALACSPSIEFWPENGGRTLVGLHLVPTPALPVMASTGSAEHFVTDFKIELEDENGELDSDEENLEPTLAELMGAIAELNEKMDKVTLVTDTILALTPIDDIEIPEE